MRHCLGVLLLGTLVALAAFETYLVEPSPTYLAPESLSADLA